MKGIVLKNISKSYADRRVFDGFSHSFAAGGATVIMGPSGCGKTTLMRLITGLEKADGGEILLPESARFGCVFQEDRLIRHMSALKNLRLVVGRKRDSEIRQFLNELGLGDSIHKPVRRLSGGMARRVAIARALLCDSDIIIMDEPFKGLDDANRRNTTELIKRCAAGKTLLLVTHDASDAESFGGEILRLGTEL